MPDDPSITHWNYRILRHGGDPEWYGVHEVYYDEGKPIACTKKPVKVIGESPEEINEDIKNIWDAFDRTVLNYNDITGDTNA